MPSSPLYASRTSSRAASERAKRAETLASERAPASRVSRLAASERNKEAQAHSGVGGAGTGACSGDLLLGALAACAQVTCQMVATAMGVPFERIAVTVEGDLDLRGTLGMAREVPVGFESIRLRFDVDAPDATPDQLAALHEKAEQYCVVMQTLTQPPAIETSWSG